MKNRTKLKRRQALRQKIRNLSTERAIVHTHYKPLAELLKNRYGLSLGNSELSEIVRMVIECEDNAITKLSEEIIEMIGQNDHESKS